MYLTELEEIGIKIIALYHVGILTDTNEGDIDLRITVPGDLHSEFDYQLSGDLMDYVPTSIISFFDKYDYLSRYPSTAVRYEDVNARFWTADKYYNSMINKLQLAKSKAESNQDKPSKGPNTSALLSHFKKKSN